MSSSLFIMLRRCIWLLVCLLPCLAAEAQSAGGNMPFSLNLGLNPATGPEDVDVSIQVLFILTILALSPTIILLMTSFTRIVVVLSFIRSAMSLQSAPSSQIVVGLSLFMSLFVMAPTWSKIQTSAVGPYSEKQITSTEALNNASAIIKEFMLQQTRPKDMELFVNMSGESFSNSTELPLNVIIPAFVISELKTAFQIGFLLFIPFIMIDLIVAVVLMSMGMMMMPPVTISMPLKILLFVLVDGWNLIMQSLLESFAT
jgi:flagellar biosynthetic protein FliP